MNKDLEEKFNNLNEKLKLTQNVLITISSPDGDSIGSSLALKNIFSKLGKKVEIQSSFEIPKYLQFVENTTEIKISDIGKTDFAKYEIIVLVDSANASRAVSFDLYGSDWDFPQNCFVISFDHHHTHNFEFADIDIFEEKISSTCELVFKYSKYSQMQLDEQTATFLFLGIYTDTGNFYHDNTTHDTYKTAGELLELGAKKHELLAGLNRKYDLESLNLLSKGLINTTRVEEKDFAYIITVLDKESLRDIDSDTLETTSNLFKGSPGFIKNIDKTDFGILIIENNDDVKVSFRENDDKYDLSIIAKEMGGGGHSKACAYSSKDTLENVIFSLKEKIRQQFS